MRFYLKFSLRILKTRHLEKHHFTFVSPEMLAGLFLLKEAKPSPDRRLIKLLTFHNLFTSLRRFR